MPITFEAPVQTEFERWTREIGEDDPYLERGGLGIQEALRAHFLIINYFYLEGEGIGGAGPKDINLLHSALSRQHTSFAGKYKWSSTFELCATLVFGLNRDHPFHDANKRTALLCCLHYLSKKGLVPTTTKKDLEDLMVRIADRDFGKSRRFKELREEHTEDDATVLYVAHFLKKNTRKSDRREQVITYRELASILNKFNFVLEDPKKNFINLYKVTRPKYIIVGPTRQLVCQIAFPGWGRQVEINTIKEVRKRTGLDAEHGCDSRVFYAGVEDLQTLIAEYQDNLRSLAYR